MPKHKLVFDFDQTLVYRDGMWTATIFELLKENGYEQVDIEDIRKYIKSCFPWDFYEIPNQILFENLTWWEYLEKSVQRILINNKIETKEATRLSKLVREKYIDINKWHLYEETHSVLKELCNFGHECYILSNHVPELENIVSGLDIKQFIRKIYNSAKIGYEKPNSGIYRHMVKDLNVQPSSIIMIGDNYISDITGARSNCINAIQVRSKNEYNYKYYCKDLQDVTSLIIQIKNLITKKKDGKN